jgi:hypothetical protein
VDDRRLDPVSEPIPLGHPPADDINRGRVFHREGEVALDPGDQREVSL